MNKHTPKGWRITTPPLFTGNLRYIVSEKDDRIATIHDGGTTSINIDVFEGVANAQLIAAAPDLLEALKTLTRETEGRAGAPKVFIEAAYAAINKAEGK